MIIRRRIYIEYRNNLLTGITELLVLSILNKMDSYIYEIVKLIANDSDNRLTLSSNTVYASAYKLEQAQMISEYSKLVGKKRTRIYYHIEPKGREHLKELQTSYTNMTMGVQRIFDKLGGSEANE